MAGPIVVIPGAGRDVLQDLAKTRMLQESIQDMSQALFMFAVTQERQKEKDLAGLQGLIDNQLGGDPNMLPRGAAKNYAELAFGKKHGLPTDPETGKITFPRSAALQIKQKTEEKRLANINTIDDPNASPEARQHAQDVEAVYAGLMAPFRSPDDFLLAKQLRESNERIADLRIQANKVTALGRAVAAETAGIYRVEAAKEARAGREAQAEAKRGPLTDYVQARGPKGELTFQHMNDWVNQNPGKVPPERLHLADYNSIVSRTVADTNKEIAQLRLDTQRAKTDQLTHNPDYSKMLGVAIKAYAEAGGGTFRLTGKSEEQKSAEILFRMALDRSQRAFIDDGVVPPWDANGLMAGGLYAALEAQGIKIDEKTRSKIENIYDDELMKHEADIERVAAGQPTEDRPEPVAPPESKIDTGIREAIRKYGATGGSKADLVNQLFMAAQAEDPSVTREHIEDILRQELGNIVSTGVPKP